MKGEVLFCLAFAILMLLCVFIIGPVIAPSTTIGVEPDSIVDPGLGPGSTFTVEIWIRGVVDLAGFEFKLGYDTTVLTATSIEYGGIFGPTRFDLIGAIYDDAGYLHYAVMEAFGEPSFTGDGRAAIITFSVDSVGESTLDLYETILGDSSVPPMPIVHVALDGYFRNVLISVTLARHSAWPEHHHYSIGKDEDSSNDFFAIVSNDGEMDMWVKVVFSVTDSATNPVGNFETDPTLLPAGAMYGYKEDTRYKAAFVPPSVGKYYVSAVCWADTDGDMVPDTPMGKVKTFSFGVVP